MYLICKKKKMSSNDLIELIAKLNYFFFLLNLEFISAVVVLRNRLDDWIVTLKFSSGFFFFLFNKMYYLLLTTRSAVLVDVPALFCATQV